MNGDDDDGGSKVATRGVVGATLVLACVLGAMCLSRQMCRPALASSGWPTSLVQWWRAEQPLAKQPQDNIRRPDSTVKALLEMNRGKLNTADVDFYNCLITKDGRIRIPFNDLQHLAWKLELTDKLPTAVTQLQRKYDECQGNEAYELGLLLVEMLIYKGKFGDAQTVLKKVEDSKKAPVGSMLSMDDRIMLYKAVISVMLDQNDAEKLYKDYKSSQNMFMRKPIEMDSSEKKDKPDETLDFKEFKNGMLALRKKIKENG